MAMDTAQTIIVYGGGMIILYAILRSWGIISPASATRPLSNWRPLTEQELNRLQGSPGDLYKYDRFEVRTGRGTRNKEFGFVGE